ncbi:MAG: hypothetical protein AB1650_06980 [Candidatus Omnitrophota bacterium]
MRKLFFISMFVCLTTGIVFAQKEEVFFYRDEGRRDPFWPLLSANGSIISYNENDLIATDMMLQGITTGSDQNMAVINGKIVKEGDMVGAYKVEAIMPAFVVLDNGQEKVELHLSRKGE